MTGDCFELLARYVEEGRRFDMVILDPPSFAKSKQNRYAAQRAYTRLNALALRCVHPGGLPVPVVLGGADVGSIPVADLLP